MTGALAGLARNSCCRGIVDWTHILRSRHDQRPSMSVRGRNLLFATAIVDALGLDPSAKRPPLAEYKKAFTAQAVRKIYEAIIEIWPPETNIEPLLEKSGADVSGLYIGDCTKPLRGMPRVREAEQQLAPFEGSVYQRNLTARRVGS
jgi:hypothetical protein